MELEVTWKRAIRVWWSYLWRNLLAIVAAMICGGIVGAIIGFILGVLGVSIETIKMVTMPIGAVLGLAISIVPVKLILGKDYGEFRVVLLSKDTPPVISVPPKVETPNKAPEPTPGSVTPRADARVAPAPVVAHL